MFDVGLDAARAGADLIRAKQFNPRWVKPQIKSSGGGVTTLLDMTVQERVFGILQDKFPRDGYWGEEEQQKGEPFPDRRNVWILDPVDGTRNLIKGYPHFCLSLALVTEGQVKAAFIIDPNREEEFIAAEGQGALMNREHIRVNTTNSMKHALLASTSHGQASETSEFDALGFTRFLYSNGISIRRSGSMTLDLVYVACGRLDGYWGHGHHPWDIAAALLFLKEAGAITTNYEGESGPELLHQKTIMTGNLFTQRFLQATMNNYTTQIVKTADDFSV